MEILVDSEDEFTRKFFPCCGFWHGDVFSGVNVDPFVKNVTEFLIDICFILTMTARSNESGNRPNIALVFF